MYCCENLNNQGRIQIMLQQSVSDEDVFEFFRENDTLRRLCNINKSIRKFDKDGNVDWVWEIYIRSENYSSVLDLMYIIYTDKIFYQNVYVYKYSENPLKKTIIHGLKLKYEEKEYDREELLDNILEKVKSNDYDQIYIIKLNALYYTKLSDNSEWTYSMFDKSILHDIYKNR